MADKNGKNTYSVKEIIEFVWDDVREIKVDVKKQNSRIRNNEKKISWIVGGLAALGAAIAIVKFF